MSVTSILLPDLSIESDYQRFISMGELIQSFLHLAEAAEFIQAVSPTANFAHGLRATKHQYSHRGGLCRIKFEYIREHVLVLDDAAGRTVKRINKVLVTKA